MEPKKVLVIDDEPAIRKLIKVILEGEGYRILGLDASRKAPASVQEGKPDLIILDLMMPEVDGYEILEMLKKDPETRDIPVIVLTVRSLPEDREKARSLGADMYITKPFEPSDLIKAVNSFFAPEGGNPRPPESD
jgi:CheY-like chemotaxis protein